LNHLKEKREGLELSQRELARRTGIAQARISRAEAGELELSEGEKRLIAIALQGGEDAAALQAEREAHAADRPPAWPIVRRAYRCERCASRTILSTHGRDVPECREHGPMALEPNSPYRGRSTTCECELCAPPGAYPAPALAGKLRGPVPTTGIFGKGEPGSGNSVIAFDPATGNVRGHLSDCRCPICAPV